MNGAVDELPRRCWAMWLVSDEMHGRRVRWDCGERDDQVAELVVRLEAAARADAHQPLAPELDELLEDDRRAGTAHSGALHRDALPFPGARVAEQAALLVHLGHVLEVRLRDVLRAERVAGEEDRVGVVARLCSEVNRHWPTLTVLEAPPAKPATPGGKPRALKRPVDGMIRPCRKPCRRPSTRCSPSAPRIRSSASS